LLLYPSLTELLNLKLSISASSSSGSGSAAFKALTILSTILRLYSSGARSKDFSVPSGVPPSESGNGTHLFSTNLGLPVKRCYYFQRLFLFFPPNLASNVDNKIKVIIKI
jgi:hypothetical protein